MADTKLSLVIDPGSDTLKAGFSGDDCPQAIFPNLGGTPKVETTDHQFGVGDEVKHKRGHYNVENAVSNGLVSNWEVMEHVLDHTFHKALKIQPKDCSVLVTEPPINARYYREKITQLMFETFGVSAFCLKDTAALSIAHAGRTTGVAVESGGGITSTSIVYEGYVIRKTIPKTFYAGRDVTNYLLQLMSEKGFSYGTRDQTYDCVTDMKEQVCYVSEDYGSDLEDARTSDRIEKQYEMPSGEMFIVNEERFIAAEALFKPELFKLDCPGIHLQLNRTLQLADVDLRRFTYPNIVLAGGNTLFPGFAERLKKELDKIIPSSLVAKVIAQPERKFAAWIGGSIMTSLDTMKDFWINKSDYDEVGPCIVNTKCF